MSPSTKNDSSSKTNASATTKDHFDPDPMVPNLSADTRERSGGTICMTTETNDDETILFETVTMSKFEKFQQKIFPIIMKIITNPAFTNHPFANLWQQAMIKPSQAISDESTLRSIQKVLPVENLQDYRRFIQECPSIDKYVIFQDSATTKAGFDVYFKETTVEEFQKKDDSNKQKGDETELSSFDVVTPVANDPSKTDTETVTFQECFGTKRDFKTLWTQVSFILNTFALEHQDDPIAIKWTNWRKQGLTTRSDFQEVKTLTNLTSLSDLFFFIRDCRPINEHMEIKWDDKILFRQRYEDATAPTTLAKGATTALIASCSKLVSPMLQKHIGTESERKVINDPPHSPFLDMFHNADENDPYVMLDYYTVDEDKILSNDDLKMLHCRILDIVDKWVMTAEGNKHGFTNTWKRWKFHGLSRERDYRFVSRLMGIEDLNGYLKAVNACPAVAKHIGWLWYQTELHY